MPQVRIGLGQLLSSRTGSVALPEEVDLFCPQCGEPAADKGQCILTLAVIADREAKTEFSAILQSDCRACGCDGKAPAANF